MEFLESELLAFPYPINHLVVALVQKEIQRDLEGIVHFGSVDHELNFTIDQAHDRRDREPGDRRHGMQITNNLD